MEGLVRLSANRTLDCLRDLSAHNRCKRAVIAVGDAWARLRNS